MRVPLLDLQSQYQSIKDELDQVVTEVMTRGIFILGDNVRRLEEEVADYLGARQAVGVASGTDALLLTLRALGVGPGDEVIVPAYTFFATAEIVMLLGATPVLVDIDPQTYCLDISEVESKVTPRTRAIIPVHLFGHPADMSPLMDTAQRHNLKVVEDNAQAIGAKYRGNKTGAIGDAGCLSFYPTKNLGAYGDGGMIITSDEGIAHQIRMLRTHGWTHKYYSEIVGYNSRLDELQAAILRVKLRYLDQWNEARRRWAASYTELLADADMGLPGEQDYAFHVYHLYVVQVDDRDRVERELREVGVSTGVYYPHPLHLMPVMQGLGYQRGDFPVSEAASQRTLAIPLYPEMTSQQVSAVAQALKSATAKGGV